MKVIKRAVLTGAVLKLIQSRRRIKQGIGSNASCADSVERANHDGVGRYVDGFASAGRKEALTLPPEYERLKQSLPTDLGIPKEAVPYGMRTPDASGLLIMYPVSETISMPFDNDQWIIDQMHEHMGENEGLIEVKSGITAKGHPYVHEIIKHRFEVEDGIPMVEYTININVKLDKTIQFINGSFKEEGTTGVRDSTALHFFSSANDMSLEEVLEIWWEDPYDSEYKKGFLMNMSEQEKLDELFPTHALSEARKLLKYIVENN